MSFFKRLFLVKTKTVKSKFAVASLEEVISFKLKHENIAINWNDKHDLHALMEKFTSAQLKWQQSKDSIPFKNLLRQMPPIEKYSSFIISYIWRANAQAALGNYDAAYKTLELGLVKSPRTDGILQTFGDLKFDQNCVESFGWWMQSCMVGGESFFPYLYLSNLAYELDMPDLNKQLLAAADLLSYSQPRMDYELIEKHKLLINNNLDVLKSACSKFENSITGYLPSPTFLPDNEVDRSVFVNLHDKSFYKARNKIIEKRSNIANDTTNKTKQNSRTKKVNLVFEEIRIGNQIWMAKNFDLEIEDGCYNYENNPENGSKYGKLYTWDAAINSTPKGWHLPSIKEWEELIEFLGGFNSDTFKKLANNGSTGFDILFGGGGAVDPDEVYFSDIENVGGYWSSTEYVSFPELTVGKAVFDRSDKRIETGKIYGKSALGSIRYIKD